MFNGKRQRNNKFIKSNKHIKKQCRTTSKNNKRKRYGNQFVKIGYFINK